MTAGDFKTMETDRLILRALTPEVYQQVFTSYNDGELRQFFGCSTDEDLAEERRKYEDGLRMYKKSFLVFQLMEKASGKVIGWCGYHTWYLPHYRAEIGYMLTDEAAKGRGYMKEALRAVLAYGFTDMGLKRVEAFIGPGNVPSLKLVKALGFTEEGTLREHYFKNGALEDSVVFSLLAREFTPPGP